MTNEVSAWLANPKRSYSEGVAIYKKYKIDNQFDAFFDSVTNPPVNSEQFRMLIRKVGNINRKLLQNPAKVEPQKSSIAPSIAVKPIETGKQANSDKEPLRPKIVDNQLVNVKELPENLQIKYFENKEKTTLIGRLHAQLKKVPEGSEYDQERKNLALKITTLDDERAANWKEIDEYFSDRKEENKKESVTEENADVLAQANKISNLKNYIRRANADSKKNPNKKAANDKKVAEWKKELNELTGK